MPMKIASRMCVHTGACIPVLNVIKILLPQGPQGWKLFPHRAISHTHRFCKNPSIFSQWQFIFVNTKPRASSTMLHMHKALHRCRVVQPRNMDVFTSRPAHPSLPPYWPLRACSGSQQEHRDGCGCTCWWVMCCLCPRSLQEENSSLSSTSIWCADCNSLWENGCLVFQPCLRDGHAGENEDLSLRNLSAVSLPFHIYKYVVKDPFSFQVAPCISPCSTAGGGGGRSLSRPSPALLGNLPRQVCMCTYLSI